MCPDQPEHPCAWAEDRFSDAVEDVLDTAERATFETHLAACESCRAGFEAFQRSLAALGEYEPRPVPGAFFESVRQATRAAAPPRAPTARRGRILALAWTAAAAAAAVAIWALATRPAPREIRVPVDREVVVERRVPVAVRVRGEGIEVVRGGRAVAIASGRPVVLEPGDELRAVPPAPPAPLQLVVNTRPLADRFDALLRDLRAARRRRPPRLDLAPLAAAVASATERMSGIARQLAEASAARTAATPGRQAAPATVAARSEPKAHAAPPDRRPPSPPVSLVRHPGGTLVLETSGAASAVIPELISLLDEDDAQVVAVALAGLEGIEERLTREHGIGGAAAIAASQAEPPGAVGPLARLLGKRPVRPEEPRPSEQWRRWWVRNEGPIRLLADGRL